MYLYFLFYVLLITTLSFSDGIHHKWCKRQCKKDTVKEQRIPIPPVRNVQKNKSDVKLYENEVSNHLPMDRCSFLPGRKTINPYKNYRQLFADRNKFSSVCLKCSTCLAIAQYMSEQLEDLLNDPQEYDATTWKTLAEEAFKETYEDGFKNFDLRRFNDQVFLAPVSSETEHVTTSFDGEWTNKLREICKEFASYIDYDSFYERALSENFGLEDYLCRGDGKFRECTNIPLHIVETPDREAYLTMCVTCNEENE